MAEILLQKVGAGALAPIDDAGLRYLKRIKLGDGVRIEVKAARNLMRHRRFFALLNLAFDAWEPADVVDDVVAPQKNFDSFRRDILILAGHCDAHYSLDGSVRFEARSISFANMPDDLAFEDVYRRVLTVVWEKILRQMRYASPEDVEEVVQQLIRFD